MRVYKVDDVPLVTIYEEGDPNAFETPVQKELRLFLDRIVNSREVDFFR